MAGIHFNFESFKDLVQLNIGISDRLDQNRAESFTMLYCDFSEIPKEVIEASLLEILRTSDSIVNHEGDYFFLLPYTDKFGAEIVKKMFDDFFAKFLKSFSLSYPADGENAQQLFSAMQDSTSMFLKNELHCLDRFSKHL